MALRALAGKLRVPAARAPAASRAFWSRTDKQCSQTSSLKDGATLKATNDYPEHTKIMLELKRFKRKHYMYRDTTIALGLGASTVFVTSALDYVTEMSNNPRIE